MRMVIRLFTNVRRNFSTSAHISVLRDEIIKSLKPKPNGIYVDCTFGAGGHSQALLGKILRSPFDVDRVCARSSCFSDGPRPICS